VSVGGGKFTEGQAFILEGMETLASSEAIELLLLVTNSVIFNYDATSEVAQEIKSELTNLHRSVRVEIFRVEGLTLIESLFVVVHVIH
jgi:hypothetical protein